MYKEHMKVFLIGGYNRVISYANELVRRDITTHVLSNKRVEGLNQKVIIHPDMYVKLKKTNPITYFQFLYSLKKKIKSNQPDIVHAFFVPWNGWFTALSGFHPFIMSTMGGDVNPLQGAYHNIFRRILTPYTLKKADLITVVTDDGLIHIDEKV